MSYNCFHESDLSTISYNPVPCTPYTVHHTLYSYSMFTLVAATPAAVIIGGTVIYTSSFRPTFVISSDILIMSLFTISTKLCLCSPCFINTYMLFNGELQLCNNDIDFFVTIFVPCTCIILYMYCFTEVINVRRILIFIRTIMYLTQYV